MRPVLLLLSACTGGSPQSPALREPADTAGQGSSPADTSPVDSAPPGPPPRVRITEVHYHPVAEAAYEDRAEFIELHNGQPESVDLTGWAFDDGVSFTAEGVSLSPGQTVIVAKDPEAILAAFPALDPAAVLGPWEGSLSNRGERIRLVDAAGAVVEEFSYKDATPWPAGPDGLGVQDDFWPEAALPPEDHTGRGRSLQRVNLDAPPNDPGTWVASPLHEPSPGEWLGNVLPGPLATVSSLTWADGSAAPLVPDTPIDVTAAFSGEPSEPRVEWFVDDLSRDDEPRSSVALEERSPGSWSATLPAQPEGTVLRARVLADLGRGEEPASPREGDPQSWHGRYVGTEPPGETRAFHLFIDPVRWTELWDLVRPGRVVGCEENPGWQARVPAVFVHEGRAVDVRVRYQGSRWNRTNGPDLRTWSAPGPERPSPPKSLSWSVKLPRYAKLDGHTRFSFNKLTQGCPGLTAQVGFQLFAAAGLPAPETRFARLFLNGAYYSYTLQIESPGEDMLERWLEARTEADPSLEEEPGVPHLFKSSGCNCDEGPFGWGDERPLGDHGGLSALDRYASTYERKTWSWDDHTALRDLIEGLDAARSGSDDGLRSFLEANFDVELVLAYMAVMNWAVPFDDMFQNHFLLQRRSDRRWMMAPWDLDRNFGGWKGAGASLYMGAVGDPDNRSGWSNRIKDAFLRVYRPEFEETLFAFNESILHPDAVSRLVDETEAQWDLEAIAAAPAGAACDASGSAEAFRQFARDRHAVVASAAASAGFLVEP